MKTGLLVVFMLLVLALAGCSARTTTVPSFSIGPSPTAGPTVETSPRVAIPMTDNMSYLSTAPYGAPDDIVPIPGYGPWYRGNVNPLNPFNAVDPVPILQVQKGDTHIVWRNLVTIAPGENKYDLITVDSSINITGVHAYAEDVPDWLTLVSSSPAVSISGRTGWSLVVAMQAPPNVSPGQYMFTLGFTDSDTDYGPLPVTIQVIRTPEAEPSPPYGTLVASGTQPAASSNGTKYPDDIVTTPGGPAYRANVHTGQANPWPPIQNAVVQLATGNITAMVQYRDDITTGAGQVRNNIVIASGNRLANGDLTLELFAIGVPEGFTVTRSGGAGLPGQTGALLRIAVAANVPPGDYTFSLALAPGGIYLGKVPVTVHVVTRPVNTPTAPVTTP